MTNYARLSEKTKQFQALTGNTLEEFDTLLPAFRNAFLIYIQTHTMEGKKRRKRRYVVYRNCPLPTVEDKLLFILMYLRKATTQDLFGEVWGPAREPHVLFHIQEKTKWLIPLTG